MDLESIKKQMKMTLSESIIPNDHKGAFLTVFDGKQLATAVATRINGHWELEGNVNFVPGHKGVTGEVKVRATW